MDDRLTGITYLNAVNATPAVSFAYDPYYPWLTAMTDGTGTRSYSYNAPFSLGALRPSQECFVATGSGPACTHSVAYGYDALGRLASRTVSGNGAETFAYDALGRLSEHDSDLGAFTLSYLGETGQPVLRKLDGTGATLQTAWGYLPNSGDRRLASIDNTGLTSGQYSTFAFTSTPENQTTGITETSDAATAYPPAGTQTATYNAVNELTDLSGQAFTYDANGNLTSDGTRAYSWDADNRLIGIAYPATPGKATTFAYDGLGRRTTISHTPAGGGTAVASNYVWCGDKLCQARDASNQPARAYYTEGERVLGSSPSSLFYGVDQIGSVRRVFESTTSAPAYAYDPYGVPLQTAAPLADFGYAGLLSEPDSGLGLATYRAYDPRVGRWISRDPIGETASAAGNLYGYVGQSVVNRVDPLGLWAIQVGGTVSGQFVLVNGQVGVGIAIDSSGNIAGYTSFRGGAGVGGEASASAGVSVSTASTVCDLKGLFANQNIAGGIIASGNVDTFEGLESGRIITGGGVSVGIGAGASVTNAITFTTIHPWGEIW